MEKTSQRKLRRFLKKAPRVSFYIAVGCLVLILIVVAKEKPGETPVLAIMFGAMLGVVLIYFLLKLTKAEDKYRFLFPSVDSYIYNYGEMFDGENLRELEEVTEIIKDQVKIVSILVIPYLVSDYNVQELEYCRFDVRVGRDENRKKYARSRFIPERLRENSCRGIDVKERQYEIAVKEMKQYFEVMNSIDFSQEDLVYAQNKGAQLHYRVVLLDKKGEFGPSDNRCNYNLTMKLLEEVIEKVRGNPLEQQLISQLHDSCYFSPIISQDKMGVYIDHRGLINYSINNTAPSLAKTKEEVVFGVWFNVVNELVMNEMVEENGAQSQQDDRLVSILESIDQRYAEKAKEYVEKKLFSE